VTESGPLKEQPAKGSRSACETQNTKRVAQLQQPEAYERAKDNKSAKASKRVDSGKTSEKSKRVEVK
jgi:hypothetical protein